MLASNPSFLNNRYTNKCFEGLGSRHLYVQTPRNFRIKNCIRMIYAIYEADVSPLSVTLTSAGMSMIQIDDLTLYFTDVLLQFSDHVYIELRPRCSQP
jgi:hypothetical protein